MGDKRGEIEAQVAESMQRVLDGYRSGIQVQGVSIKQADPPEAVNEAFKEVTAAQQDAQSYINQANAYALQLTAKAQGEADRVRQGLRAVQARARSDPATHVLRNDGAGAFEGRQDDHRSAGRDALSAAAARSEAQQQQERQQ